MIIQRLASSAAAPQQMFPRTTPPAAHAPFIVGGLVISLLIGVLNGGWNLWLVRAQMTPVPIQHHQSHAMAQLFGLFLLFIMGVSLRVVPAFFGTSPLPKRHAKWLAALSITATSLLVLGRFGRLLPGSDVFGVLGASLVVAAVVTWALLLASWYRKSLGVPDALPLFIFAGTASWVVAALLLWFWQLGQVTPGPLAGARLDIPMALALQGGVGLWLAGVFFRAGICTLHISRPTLRSQKLIFGLWSAAAVMAPIALWVSRPGWSAASDFISGAAMAALLREARPWRMLEPDGQRLFSPGRIVRLGFVFGAVYVALCVYSAITQLGVLARGPFVDDALRHAFSIGFALLLLCGFAARMVPGFEGVPLRWPRVFANGVVGLTLGVSFRLFELAGVHPATRAGAGVSAILSSLGFIFVASSLWGTMAAGRRGRNARQSEEARAVGPDEFPTGRPEAPAAVAR